MAAREAASDIVTRRPAMWALPELVEAATRSGDTELARDALARLIARPNRATRTSPAASKRVAGRCSVTVRRPRSCTAKRSSGSAAHGSVPDLARAHLLYGEWLRREGRRVDAREQLRRAHDMLTAIGMAAFAERARRELIATGDKVRKRQRREPEPAHPAGGADRPPRPRRLLEPGDRRPTVHQRPHRRVAPEQCLHEARHQLAPAAAGRSPQGQSRPHGGLAVLSRPRAPRGLTPGSSTGARGLADVQGEWCNNHPPSSP